MTSTTYRLEAINDGAWETVHESADPLSIMQPSLDLSMKQRSTRTTVIYADDPLAGKVIGNVRDIPARPLHTPGVDDSFNRTAQKPTVGRVVHYCAYVAGEPVILAAIITQIGKLDHESRTPDVKLHIFWPDDNQHMPNGGWHVFSEDPKAGYWSWPPRV